MRNLFIFFSGDVATVAGEAGLPFAGLVGLGLRLGARIFRSDQGDDNIRFIGQMVCLEKNSALISKQDETS